MTDKLEVPLDEDDLRLLADRASALGHTPEQEAAAIVRQELHGRRHDIVEWSRRIRAMTPKDIPQTDSLTLLREDRDR